MERTARIAFISSIRTEYFVLRIRRVSFVFREMAFHVFLGRRSILFSSGKWSINNASRSFNEGHKTADKTNA